MAATIIVPGMEVKQLAMPRLRLGEGPRWVEEQQALILVDCFAMDLRRHFVGSGRNQVLHIGEYISSEEWMVDRDCTVGHRNSWPYNPDARPFCITMIIAQYLLISIVIPNKWLLFMVCFSGHYGRDLIQGGAEHLSPGLDHEFMWPTVQTGSKVSACQSWKITTPRVDKETRPSS